MNEEDGGHQDHPCRLWPKLVVLHLVPINAVVTEHDQEHDRKPVPRHQVRGGVKELPINELQEQQRSHAQRDGEGRYGGHGAGNAAREFMVLGIAPAKEAGNAQDDNPAQEKVHRQQVQDKCEHQQKLEQPGRRGQGYWNWRRDDRIHCCDAPSPVAPVDWPFAAEGPGSIAMLAGGGFKLASQAPKAFRSASVPTNGGMKPFNSLRWTNW